MIKGISSINGWVKAGALSALLAGSTAMYASNPTKEVNNTLNQTEVVSKAGADALKAANMQIIQQETIPTVHNPNLDATLQKFIESKEDKAYIDNIINNVYKNNGTFLGSVLMQQEIDFQQLCSFLLGNTDIQIKNNINPDLGNEIQSMGTDFFKSIESDKDNLISFFSDNYLPSIVKLLSNTKAKDGNSVNEHMDKIADNLSYFNDKDKLAYKKACNNFIKEKNKDNFNNIDKANLSAYKMFVIDKMFYSKLLSAYGIFSDSNTNNMEEYFSRWMDSVKPSVK